MGATIGAILGAANGYAKGIELQKHERIAAVTQESELGNHRPYIRKDVRNAVEAAAKRTPDGRFVDPNTRMPIDGKYNLGHKRAFEYWRLKQWAKERV